MSLHELFGTDKNAEEKGVWVWYGEEEDKAPGFLIARMGKSNKKYSKTLEKNTRAHRRAIELETMKEDQADKIFLKTFCKSVLLDWKNVTTKDGKTLPFSTKNAIELLTDLPDLYDDLNEKARKATLFREETQEEDAKN